MAVGKEAGNDDDGYQRAIDPEDVRDAVATLRGKGRRYVKCTAVVRTMGLPDRVSHTTAVGQELSRASYTSKWNDPVSGGVTWEIVPDSPREILDTPTSVEAES